ncbi:uncharacterized protein RNJ42_03165 [Nakaseomyces bracarensis]|uniref:uncharacterized protein n=1 Tax=Nakaseomyces bracarensis TaxID=273131 RepID=UPI00387235FC
MGLASYCTDSMLSMLSWHNSSDITVKEASKIVKMVGVRLIKRKLRRKWQDHLDRVEERRERRERKAQEKVEKKPWYSGFFPAPKAVVEEIGDSSPTTPPDTVMKKIRGWFTKSSPKLPPRILMVNKDSSVEFSDETINRKTMTSLPEKITMDITEDMDSYMYPESDSSLIVMKAVASILSRRSHNDKPERCEKSSDNNKRWSFFRKSKKTNQLHTTDEPSKLLGIQKFKQKCATIFDKLTRKNNDQKTSTKHEIADQSIVENDQFSTEDLTGCAGLLVMSRDEKSLNTLATIAGDSTEERILYNNAADKFSYDIYVNNDIECLDKENVNEDYSLRITSYDKMKLTFGGPQKQLEQGVIVNDKAQTMGKNIVGIENMFQKGNNVVEELFVIGSNKSSRYEHVPQMSQKKEASTEKVIIDDLIERIESEINELKNYDSSSSSSIIKEQRLETARGGNDDNILSEEEKDGVIKDFIKRCNNVVIDYLSSHVSYEVIGKLIGRIDNDISNVLDGEVHRNTIDSLIIRISNDISHELVEYVQNSLIEDQIDLVKQELNHLYEYVSDVESNLNDSIDEKFSHFSSINKYDSDGLCIREASVPKTQSTLSSLSHFEDLNREVAVDEFMNITFNTEDGASENSSCTSPLHINSNSEDGQNTDSDEVKSVQNLSSKKRFYSFSRIRNTFDFGKLFNSDKDGIKHGSPKNKTTAGTNRGVAQITSSVDSDTMSVEILSNNKRVGSVYETAPSPEKTIGNVAMLKKPVFDDIVHEENSSSEKKNFFSKFSLHLNTVWGEKKTEHINNDKPQKKEPANPINLDVIDITAADSFYQEDEDTSNKIRTEGNSVEQKEDRLRVLLHEYLNDPEDIGDLDKLLKYLENPLDHWPNKMPTDIQVIYDRFLKDKKPTHECIINKFGEEVIVPIKSFRTKVDDTCKKVMSFFKNEVTEVVEEESKPSEPQKLTDEILEDHYYKRLMRRFERQRERAENALHTGTDDKKVDDFCKILENYSDVPPEDPIIGAEFDLAPRVQNYLDDPNRPSLAKTGAFALLVASDREKIRLKKLQESHNDHNAVPKSMLKAPMRNGGPLMCPDGKIPLPVLTKKKENSYFTRNIDNNLGGSLQDISDAKKTVKPLWERIAKTIPDDVFDDTIGDLTLERITIQVKERQEIEMNKHDNNIVDSGGTRVSKITKEARNQNRIITTDHSEAHLHESGDLNCTKKCSLADLNNCSGEEVQLNVNSKTNVSFNDSLPLKLVEEAADISEIKTSVVDSRCASLDTSMYYGQPIMEEKNIHSVKSPPSNEDTQKKHQSQVANSGIEKLVQFAKLLGFGSLIPTAKTEDKPSLETVNECSSSRDHCLDDRGLDDSSSLKKSVESSSSVSNSAPNSLDVNSSQTESQTEVNDKLCVPGSSNKECCQMGILPADVDGVINSPLFSSESSASYFKQSRWGPGLALAINNVPSEALKPLEEDTTDFIMPDGTKISCRRKRDMVINYNSHGIPGEDYLGKPQSCNPTPVWVVGPHERFLSPKERAARVPIYKKKLPEKLKSCLKKKFYISLNVPLNYDCRIFYINYVILTPREVEELGYDYSFPYDKKAIQDLSFNFYEWLESEEEVDSFDIVKPVPFVNMWDNPHIYVNYWVEKLRVVTKKKVRQVVGQKRIYFKTFVETCEFNAQKCSIDVREKIRHAFLAAPHESWGIPFPMQDVTFLEVDFLLDYQEGKLTKDEFERYATKQYMVKNKVDRTHPDYPILLQKQEKLFLWVNSYDDNSDFSSDEHILAGCLVKSLAICLVVLGNGLNLPTFISLGSSKVYDFVLSLDERIKALNNPNAEMYPFGNLEELAR